MLQYLERRNTNMFPFISISGQAYIRADHIHGVCDCAATPRITDTRACELIVPTFSSRSVLTLSNGMRFYSARSHQELNCAIAQVHPQAQHSPMTIVAISRYMSVNAAYIVAVLPYHRQLCDVLKESNSSIHCTSQTPRCLILLDDGTCLLAASTPTELMDKLNAQQA